MCFAGNAADYQGLLSFKDAIPNFDINLRRGQYTGWLQGGGIHHCAWAGVTCSNGSVIGLQLLQNASWHRGEPCQEAHCILQEYCTICDAVPSSDIICRAVCS